MAGQDHLRNSSMEALAEQYAEVLIDTDKVEIAEALGPLSSRTLLGKKSMIFEDVPFDQLAGLGELHTPSVVDLFVAKMQHHV